MVTRPKVLCKPHYGKVIPNGEENVFLWIMQAVMEVLNKSHFSLQMENCPIPIAEHSGKYKLKLHSYSFFKVKNNFSLFGLSDEVLCFLVAQRAASQLPEIKFGDTKKRSGTQTRAIHEWCRLAQVAELFSYLQLWHLAVLYSLELQGYIVSHLKVL